MHRSSKFRWNQRSKFQPWRNRSRTDYILRQVDGIVVQASGKLIVGGTFFSFNDVPWQSLARLNADGSLDTSYGALALQSIYELAPDRNGKVLVGGDLTSIGGTSQGNLADSMRMESPDLNFELGSNADAPVLSITLYGTDGYLVGGNFRQFDGRPHQGIMMIGTLSRSSVFDFDGDLKTDLSVFGRTGRTVRVVVAEVVEWRQRGGTVRGGDGQDRGGGLILVTGRPMWHFGGHRRGNGLC